MRQAIGSFRILGLVLLGVAIILILWRGPDLLLAGTVRGHNDKISTKEYADLLDNYRKTLAQIVGGIGLVFTLFFTWKTYRLSEREKITNRFAKAVELLGSQDKNGNPAWEPRMGGIYALGEVARESPGDHFTVIHILATYLRHYAKRAGTGIPSTGPPVWRSREVQAILSVIGNRETNRERNTPLIDLSGLDFRHAYLHSADLTRLNLSKVDLSHASLYMAKFNYSNLRESVLVNADFTLAIFGICSLEDADLTNARLHGAILSKCAISQSQIDSAKGNKLTELPPHLRMPPTWI
jgi:hypothetical protein